MTSGALNRTVPVAIWLLTATVAGCRDAPPAEKTVLVKADKVGTAFFDRPKALAAVRASSSPTPLVVMVQSNPWRMVIGSDSPTFALYSDGTAIFQTRSGFRSVKLDRARTDDLVQTFGDPALAALSGDYRAANASDQPDNALLIYGSTPPVYITVYGSLENASVRSKLPSSVLKAYDRLRGFSASNSRPWLPEAVEVMLTPYENAREPSIAWPKRWPDLNDPTTRQRGDSYSIALPSAELPALRVFLARRATKGAVEIDGRKWAAHIRLPFPHESLWMAPATG
ncbi:hypothetical protein [Sphingomonas faeni]|uniref:hypothetical protein n=1 Tax=Sphingomonas faeni TaxID=185950 RepID=UPI0020C79A28|nr:hypothetical protein [Sphingomonas faeni]MCP8889304.1 hypothetical protein [Sphingomonas faeni]